MGLFSFLPTVKICCCTKNLKLGCFYICVLGMLMGCSKVHIVLYPQCSNLYQGSLGIPLLIFKWFIFILALLQIATCFGFLYGIFFGQTLVGYVLIVIGLVTTTVSILYAIFYIIQMSDENGCDTSYAVGDPLTLMLWFVVWLYFSIVINSYLEEKENE